ncbi:pilus assembly protein [Altererythrobacter sp. B11]|uniref:Flp family type IVb pilin n=1 Tax=Altererythrobacter sp. B11 TaxID=2060312 RepID=UPI000DC70D7A|nr:Flp family type IVb pilin [Altererythrobacter sp. B11]BBC72864.1 pilus assembly protein [Altererythrobacter sp. B11]
MKTILRNESGATAIEYGLIVALIVIAMMAALQGVADGTIEIWTTIREQVHAVMG